MKLTPSSLTETVKRLDKLFPGHYAAGLLDCVGKRCHQVEWQREAVKRYAACKAGFWDRESYLLERARHFCAAEENSLGHCAPPGEAWFDADTSAALWALIQIQGGAAPRQRTKNGIHILVRVPEGLPGHFCVPGETRVLNGSLVSGEIKLGGKGYVIVEPSLHVDDGTPYKIEEPLREEGAPDADPRLLAMQGKRPAPEKGNGSGVGIGLIVHEGGRHEFLLKAGMRDVGKSKSEIELRRRLEMENQLSCKPPVHTDEVAQIACSTWNNRERWTRGGDFVTNPPPPEEGAFQAFRTFDAACGPEFPLEALTGTLRAWVEGLAEELQVPTAAVGLWTLGAVSACVAGRFVASPRRNWSEPANLYVVAALSPGGLKSAAMARIYGPVHAFEREYNEKHKRERRSTAALVRIAEKRAKKFEQAAAEAPEAELEAALFEATHAQDALWQALAKQVHVLTLVTCDITPEAMVTLMARNEERLAIGSAEGNEFFALLGGRYGGEMNQDFALKAHAGDYHRADRQAREPVELDHPALTLTLAVQPETIDKIRSDPELRGRGMLARFLFAVPAERVGERVWSCELDSEVEARYGELLGRLLRIEEHRAVIGLADDARARLLEFRDEVEIQMGPGGDYAAHNDWSSKMTGCVLRIAINLHCFEALEAERHPGTRTLVLETLERAISVVLWNVEHTSLVLVPVDPPAMLARKLWHWIRKREDPFEPFILSDAIKARRLVRVERPAYEEALDLLVSRGYLRKQAPESGSKMRSVRFHTNPISVLS